MSYKYINKNVESNTMGIEKLLKLFIYTFIENKMHLIKIWWLTIVWYSLMPIISYYVFYQFNYGYNNHR